ncbi:DNA topoisomerase IB [Desulfocurvibacter africanus]|nr:DNA topoisomerase IB [Desulfocurvibacter africanus]
MMAQSRYEPVHNHPEAEEVLRFSSDQEPGLRRVRRGKGFAYFDSAGSLVTDPEVKTAIRLLAIPPAWRDVWICADRKGHIQATGRDARGRKQYLYHSAWTEERSHTKFRELASFARVLPDLRRAVDRDLSRPGLPRRKVLALVVKLMEETMARVGNPEYAQRNKTYGLTTLRDGHLDESCSPLCLRFPAKGGRERQVRVASRKLAALVRRCQELPGQHLFAYEDGQGVHAVGSRDVNEYLREVGGPSVTAKVFRTWGATVLAARELSAMEPPASLADGKRKVAAAMRKVASRLGNTPAVARASYVHPAVVSAFLHGRLCVNANAMYAHDNAGLLPAEVAVTSLLEARKDRRNEADAQGGESCPMQSGKEP